MNIPSLEPSDSAYRNFLLAVVLVLRGVLSLIQAATELYVAARGRTLERDVDGVLKCDAAGTGAVEPRKAPSEVPHKELEVTELDRAAASAAARKLGLVFNGRKR